MKLQKRIICILLGLSLLCSLLPLQVWAEKLVPGDANGDNECTYVDAMLALQAAVGLEPVTDRLLTVCDTDGDGALTYLDAMVILQAAVGLVTLPPIEDSDNTTVTIPVSGNDNALSLEGVMEGDTLKLDELKQSDIDQVIGDPSGEAVIEIDLTALTQEVAQVALSVNTLQNIVDAAEDAGHDQEALQIAFAGGSVKLDDQTLRSIAAQAEGAEVTLAFEAIDNGELNQAQQTALSDLDTYGAFTASLVCADENQKISDFRGGTVALSVPFTVPADKAAADFQVWYVSDSGDTEPLETWFEDGRLFWNVGHFSDFIIVAKQSQEGPVPSGGSYTYQEQLQYLSPDWNPHTYGTRGEAYGLQYITAGLYTLIFNDKLHPVSGMATFEGYTFLPEMAASLPVDVTAAVKASHPVYGIPEDATEGYAYKIALNPKATWEDGTPITADDYVESMKRLLDPRYQNPHGQTYNYFAGAENYLKQGSTALIDNSQTGLYDLPDLIPDAQGNYRTPEGAPVYLAINHPTSWLGGSTLADYIGAYGDEYFGMENWDTLLFMADSDGKVPCNDQTLSMLLSVVNTPTWGENETYLYNYMLYAVDYPAVGFDTVGLFKSGDYEITLVFNQPLTGFALLNSLAENWLVKTDLYDACLVETDGVWTSTYCTAVDTTLSYGPYKLVDYRPSESMRFVKNENWYGYTDGKHIYEDPDDGKTYAMYQTTEILGKVFYDQVEARDMFLSGQLTTFTTIEESLVADLVNTGLASYITGTGCYSLVVNGYKEAIQYFEGGGAHGFDASLYDREILLVPAFRKAMSLSIDRVSLAASNSVSHQASFGLLNDCYVVDVETGLTYRNTELAKQNLCKAYGVNTALYASLDEAVASITGYNPGVAAKYYQEAFQMGLAAGFINDENGDGICDQTISLSFGTSTVNERMERMVQNLNQQLEEATQGTPFEGKIRIYLMDSLGYDWTYKFKEGMVDLGMIGWSAGQTNPFTLIEVYANPSYQLDKNWNNGENNTLTITVEGKVITMNLCQWAQSLQYEVYADGVYYDFSEGVASLETRLSILAAIESVVMESGYYIPIMSYGTTFLMSPRNYYVADEPLYTLEYGGVAYLRYHYDDSQWETCLAENNGRIPY